MSGGCENDDESHLFELLEAVNELLDELAGMIDELRDELDYED